MVNLVLWFLRMLVLLLAHRLHQFLQLPWRWSALDLEAYF